MKLTPLDIRKQEFARNFRGFDPDEVHAFLQMLSDQWEELLNENRQAEQRIRELEGKLEHYQRVEEALQEALRTARETSRQTLDSAREKAQSIKAEAEARAKEIALEAKQKQRTIEQEAVNLSHKRNELVARLRAFLISEMELLARFEGEDLSSFLQGTPAENRPLGLARPPAADVGAGPTEAQRAAAPPHEARGAADTTATPIPSPEGGSEPGPVPDALQAAGVLVSADEAEDAFFNVADTADAALDVDASMEDLAFESPGDEADLAADEDAEAPAMEEAPPEEARTGWVMNAVVGNHGEEEEEETESPADTSAAQRQDAASADEIERIRRILKDLD